jgi:hypothetical protein
VFVLRFRFWEVVALALVTRGGVPESLLMNVVSSSTMLAIPLDDATDDVEAVPLASGPQALSSVKGESSAWSGDR